MKYKIRTISIFHFVFAFMTIILSFAYIASKIDEKPDELIAYLIATILIFIIYWISVKLTSGIAEITLSKKHIEFNWLKKPLLKSQDNHHFDLDEIDNWNFQREFHYDSLDINCHSSSISISRLPEWGHNKDDFHSFINSFSQKIERINKKRLKNIQKNKKSEQKEDRKEPIKDQEAIFNSSNTPKILLVIYIILMILGVFHVYNNWNTGTSNILMVIAGISGCIYYIRKYRKNQ